MYIYSLLIFAMTLRSRCSSYSCIIGERLRLREAELLTRISVGGHGASP